MQDDPQKFVSWQCPGCASTLSARASEDFASAAEDLLCQLWTLSQSARISIELSTDSIPPAFRPPGATDAPGWDD